MSAALGRANADLIQRTFGDVAMPKKKRPSVLKVVAEIAEPAHDAVRFEHDAMLSLRRVRAPLRVEGLSGAARLPPWRVTTLLLGPLERGVYASEVQLSGGSRDVRQTTAGTGRFQVLRARRIDRHARDRACLWAAEPAGRGLLSKGPWRIALVLERGRALDAVSHAGISADVHPAFSAPR